MISLQLFLSLALGIFVAGVVFGAVLGGWSTARAYEEGERTETGYEPTGTP